MTATGQNQGLKTSNSTEPSS